MPPKISRRAGKAWDRLKQWYGTRLADSYGDLPPEDWCTFFDRTDAERLDAALIHVRHQTPVHPPTLGQLEDAVPKRDSGNSGPSKPQRLANLLLATHPLCHHQRAARWNYFGPMATFEIQVDKKKPDYVTHPDPRGVQCPPCDLCDRPSFRVLLEQEVSQGVAA